MAAVSVANGVVFAGSMANKSQSPTMFALDAKTGEPLEGFGDGGQASVILDVLKQQYPDVETAISMGYWFTTAPQMHNGVLYVGSTRSESRIPGGHVLAIDGKTGEVLWHFNTVPGAKDGTGTWPNPENIVLGGGGVWTPLSLDPETEELYVAVTNRVGPVP